MKEFFRKFAQKIKNFGKKKAFRTADLAQEERWETYALCFSDEGKQLLLDQYTSKLLWKRSPSLSPLYTEKLVKRERAKTAVIHVS